MSLTKKVKSTSNKALFMGTIAMLISFMSWSSISPLANAFSATMNIGINMQKLLVAVPVLLGSILRIPLGALADHYGGKKVYLFLMSFSMIPLIGIPIALSTPVPSVSIMFCLAFLLGISGSSFAVSLSYVSAWYSPNEQGRVLGIVGIGTIGNAVSAAILPSITTKFHSITSAYYFLILLTGAFIIIFAIFADEMPITNKPNLKNNLSVFKNYKILSLSISCMLASGSFVAFGALIPTLIGEKSIFNVSPAIAGLWSSAFSILTVIFRPIGGKLADKYRSKLLLISTLFGIFIVNVVLAFNNNNFSIFIVGMMIFALFIGLGNGFIFEMVASSFRDNVGTASGIIGAMGSLGGFVFPIIFALFSQLCYGFIFLACFSIVSYFSILITFKN